MNKRFKSLLSLICVVMIFASSFVSTAVFAEEDKMDYIVSKLYINDYYVHDMPHEFIIVDGVSMLAISDIATPMLITPAYNKDKTTATVVKSTKNANLTFTAGSLVAVNNGVELSLRKAPFVKDGDLYVPLKEYCDVMGYITEYNSEENAVYIYTYAKELIKAMEPFNQNCVRDDLIDWLIGQYDPEIGGFYYAGSSKLYPQFSTHIEPTLQAFSTLDSAKLGGFYNRDMSKILPDDVKERLGKYIQSCQSNVDGYFYDWWCSDETKANTAKKSRDLNWSKTLLKYAGVEPLYLLPEQRLAASNDLNTAVIAATNSVSIMDRYSSKNAMISYLDSLDWSDSYNTGNQLASQVQMIKAAGLSKVVADYLQKKQNPDTGMWQDGYNYYSCNGVMKIAAFYNSSGIPFPNPDNAIMSVLKTLEGDDIPETACEVWNVIDAIDKILASNNHQVSPETKAAIDSALLDIMALTLESMKMFEKYDGGYSYYPETTQTKINGAVAALGLAESEMDATKILTYNMRASFYSIMGGSIIPPALDYRKDEIISRLSNAPKVQKLDIPTGFSYDFSDSNIGTALPSGIGASKQQGKVSIAIDPLNPDNKVLSFTKAANSVDSFSISPYFKGSISDVTFECDLMVDYIPAGGNFYNGIELHSGVQWCVSSTDGKTFGLSLRTNESGVGQILKSGLEYGKWHKIKIRYQPDGLKNTVVTLYHNGQIIARTPGYFNAGVASNPPATSIQSVSFHGFKASSGQLYFDNIKLYENK